MDPGLLAGQLADAARWLDEARTKGVFSARTLADLESWLSLVQAGLPWRDGQLDQEVFAKLPEEEQQRRAARVRMFFEAARLAGGFPRTDGLYRRASGWLLGAVVSALIVLWAVLRLWPAATRPFSGMVEGFLAPRPIDLVAMVVLLITLGSVLRALEALASDLQRSYGKARAIVPHLPVPGLALGVLGLLLVAAELSLLTPIWLVPAIIPSQRVLLLYGLSFVLGMLAAQGLERLADMGERIWALVSQRQEPRL